jgi:glutamyl-tRNA synthetase
VLYTFASVVDDVDFGITDIVRGSDHVTNTATQIQIIEALGATPPRFAHHSLLTGPQGEALSKRLGTLSLRDLRQQGVEPMALLSLMARLGSADPVELRTSHDELIEGFDISRFGAAPTKFDADDLFPLTQRYLAALPFETVKDRVLKAGVPEALAERFWNTVKDNIRIIDEVDAWWKLFAEGAEPVVESEDRDFVKEAFALLPEMPFDETTWGAWTEAVKAATGRKGKALFMPLRKALTGREKGPEMADVMPLLQKRPALS